MMNSTDKDKKPRFYIENLGDSTLENELANLMQGSSGISKHPWMACLDRQGNRITRNVYEVPVDVKDNICRMARRAGFQFVIYEQVGDGLPRDILRIFSPVRIDPFKEARLRRARGKSPMSRPTLNRLPVGVMRSLRP